MNIAAATAEKELRRESLVRWLDGLADWEVFFTGTTRYSASRLSLKRSYERFMKNNYRHISYVYTLEQFGHGGFHVHSLFTQPFGMDWKKFWRRWFDQYGRARTEPIRHKADVQLYVCKYVTKAWDHNREELVGDPPRSYKERNEIWWDVKLAGRDLKKIAA
tara:strand:- start:117 stop:602 length:486 start_codon:yes stop_codon:yes gene_type:complete